MKYTIMSAAKILIIIPAILVLTNAMQERDFGEYARVSVVQQGTCTSRVEVQRNGVMKMFQGCKSSKLTTEC